MPEIEKKFDISIEPVNKIPVPLLVVGLGGTGCDVLQTVKRVFAERFILPKSSEGKDLPAPERTAYLGIDSLSIRPAQLEAAEYVDITLPGMSNMLTNQNTLLKPHERTWINSNLRHTTGGIGMGTIRQAARLALSRNYDKVSAAIGGALRKILSAYHGDNTTMSQQYEIAIITGIGGGTGSGIFLDIAQIIRDEAKNASVIPAKLTGYIVMPDVSLANVVSAAGMNAPIEHNAYAALKELDFWMRVKEHETPYTMIYGQDKAIEWKEPPFDNCTLISGSNTEGINYKAPYRTVQDTIAENLLHYMAHEDAVENGYSYRQYEDNLAAINVVMSYPLSYRYRTVGAFTKRIPKKPILYYEGSLLLDTFIPMRDSDGNLRPDRRLFTDGKSSERALKITEPGKKLLDEFSSLCPLPEFCRMDLHDAVKVGNVQNGAKPPHNRRFDWEEKVCVPVALTQGEKYLAATWKRFCDFARSIITNPELGPFALKEYLDAPDGLLKDLSDTLTKWQAKLKTDKNTTLKTADQMCTETWPGFCHPPILGKMKALEAYDHAIKTLYDTIRRIHFLEYYSEALDNLIKRIKEYLADGLKPVCAIILSMEKEFDGIDTSDHVVAQDIYSLDAVRSQIDQAFKDNNAENSFTAKFLDKLTDFSLENQKSVEKNTSGVAFTCRRNGAEKLSQEMQNLLEESFGSVNDQSLDDVMLAQIGKEATESEQREWISQLAGTMKNAALPMFKMDAVYKHEKAAPYIYMSVPKNAKKCIAHLKEAIATDSDQVQPKESSLTDHIYCLMAYDKIPLYRYASLDDMRRQYDSDLASGTAPGMHLVFTGNPDATFMENWSLLPAPKPFFLFPADPTVSESEKKLYEKVKNLTARGIECGMITVSDDQVSAEVDIRILLAPNHMPYTSADMLAGAKAIQEEINPATGEKYPLSVQCEKLADYLKTASVRHLTSGQVHPAGLSGVLGMGGLPCDPFDSVYASDSVKLQQAKANYRKLCVLTAEAMIYRRPDLFRAIEMQLDAYEQIYTMVHASEKAQKAWENRLNFADEAASLFIFLHDDIFLGVKGYRYKFKGEKYDIEKPGLISNDLVKIESDLLRCCAYLADRPADDPDKSELLNMSRKAEKDYESSFEDGELTREDLDELIQAAEELKSEAAEDKEKLEHALRTTPEDSDALKQQIKMLAAIEKEAGSRKNKFSKQARGL